MDDEDTEMLIGYSIDALQGASEVLDDMLAGPNPDKRARTVQSCLNDCTNRLIKALSKMND